MIKPRNSPDDAVFIQLRNRAAFGTLDELAWIKVTGADRLRWLNGMVTNSVQSLAPGGGCYNYFLSAQGRIQGDATAFLADDAIVLETGASQRDALMQMLDRFIIMDEVELEAVADRAGLVVAGPEAAAVLVSFGLSTDGLQPLRLISQQWKNAPVDVIAAFGPVVARFEVWGNARTIVELGDALRGEGVPHADAKAWERLRILEGTPLYGVDIRDKDLPQETAQDRALHFSKGCYLGQEIVERIHSRGAVRRTFTGFLLQGESAAAGTQIFADMLDGKPVGEVTSVLEAGDTGQMALGYIRREALERGATLLHTGGTVAHHVLPFDLG